MLSLNPKAPIGIFDSGIGGLTVANAIVKSLPNENIIYYGDTAHLPYGDKSVQAIRQYTVGITHFLLEQHCKMVIVACNTASAAAYETLHSYFDDRVLLLDVIRPLVSAVAARKFKKVGVIATRATTQSAIYERKLLELQPDLEVVSLATPLLVPMIEEGFIHNQISQEILSSYLSRPELEGIDALLLACTHYPLIRKEIEAFYNGEVEIFDSIDVVADAAGLILAENNLVNTPHPIEHRFYVSDYTDSFEKTTQLFYGGEVKLEHLNIWS